MKTLIKTIINHFKTRKEEKKSAKAAYKAAKIQLRETKKAYRRTTRLSRLLTTVLVMSVLVGLFSFGFAKTVPQAEVDKMIELVQTNDLATIPAGAIVGPAEDDVQEWIAVTDPWVESDNNRILYFGLNDSGFNAIASNYEGVEVSKIQEGTVTGIDDEFIEITVTDGNIYQVVNEYGYQLDDFAVICFLLAAE